MLETASDELARRVLAGDRRAAARVITLLETGDERARPIMSALYPHSGGARVVGITGAAGTGKSTLVDRLIEAYRSRGAGVGVVVVDPSSPFSGGAFLGDRLRMQRHTRDDGVFIRSMASRGFLGGLARASWETVRVMEAMGLEVILVETIGAGQDEVGVLQVAPTCVLVITPGMGDEIQALKAGLMEIASLFVVNKSDLEGHVQAMRAIEAALSLKQLDEGAWKPPIVATVASDGRGIDRLVEAIQEHEEHLQRGGGIESARSQRVSRELDLMFRDELERIALRELEGTGNKATYARQILAGERDPYSVIDEVLEKYLKLRPGAPE
jgi:LAO/AO transport system kinase